MNEFIEEIINLAESHCILNYILNNDCQLKTIIQEDTIILLYNNLKITFFDNFILINIKMNKRLSKNLIKKLCGKIYYKNERKNCTYNRKENVSIITLINAEKNHKKLYNIIKFFINLI